MRNVAFVETCFPDRADLSVCGYSVGNSDVLKNNQVLFQGNIIKLIPI
jgi:hypothetical protein